MSLRRSGSLIKLCISSHNSPGSYDTHLSRIVIKSARTSPKLCKAPILQSTKSQWRKKTRT